MKFNATQKEYHALLDYLRGEMKRQKIRQDDMAYRLNLSQTAMSNRLSGKIELTVWEFINICEILGVEFEYGRKS